MNITPETVRVDWGVPLRWAQDYAGWEGNLRKWLKTVRAAGLTQIVVRPLPNIVELTAIRPGDKWEDLA